LQGTSRSPEAIDRAQDYTAAAAITVGCALFPLSGSISAKAAQAAAATKLHTTGFGVLLMVTYLAFDGFTSTWQVGRVHVASALPSSVPQSLGATGVLLMATPTWTTCLFDIAQRFHPASHPDRSAASPLSSITADVLPHAQCSNPLSPVHGSGSAFPGHAHEHLQPELLRHHGVCAAQPVR